MEAGQVYQNLLAVDGRNIGALVGLGRIALQSGNLHAAVPYFEKAVKMCPRAAELRNQLAAAFLQLGRPDKAEAQALISHKLDKNSVETLKILSDVYHQFGKPAKAQLYIEQAVRLRPGDPSLTLALAQSSDASGDVTKALALYRELIASGHGSALAYLGLAFSQRFNEEPPELAAIEALLSDNKTSRSDRAILRRAAGKIYEQLGHYERAFAYFSAASESRARVSVAEEASLAENIQRIKTMFTPQYYLDHADFANKSQRPVFVVGMPRSGTTLVEQILASHPEVHGAGELQFFGAETKRLAHNRLGRREAQKIAKDYLHLLHAYSPRAARVVDKMPHNFERLWLIALLFPRASFIHCRRDPLATCVSCLTNYYVGELGALGRFYRHYHDLMAFWRQTLPVTILDVDYEALIDDQEGQSRKLIEHIGLDWNDSCLRFHATKRSVQTPSRRQVAQPIYRSSLEGWRRYEKHLQPLIETLGDLIRPSSQPMSTARAAEGDVSEMEKGERPTLPQTA
jgi:tetratricopeptide (TPR) repeat protein